jgi:hypothetical protein
MFLVESCVFRLRGLTTIAVGLTTMLVVITKGHRDLIDDASSTASPAQSATPFWGLEVQHEPLEVASCIAPWFALYALLWFGFRSLGPTLFDYVSQLDDGELAYWAACCCSVVNGVLLSVLAVLACREADLWTTNDFFRTSPLTFTAIYALLGYILVDSMVLFSYREAKAFASGFGAFAFHHAATFGGWLPPCIFGVLHSVVVPMLLTEATAPFVNGRYFLSKAGHKKTLLYQVNGVLIFLSWIAVRLVFVGYIIWQVAMERREEFLELPFWLVAYYIILVVAGWGLQWMWFWAICKGLWSVLFPPAPTPTDRT